jgi:hypothetical protein
MCDFRLDGIPAVPPAETACEGTEVGTEGVVEGCGAAAWTTGALGICEIGAGAASGRASSGFLGVSPTLVGGASLASPSAVWPCAFWFGAVWSGSAEGFSTGGACSDPLVASGFFCGFAVGSITGSTRIWEGSVVASGIFPGVGSLYSSPDWPKLSCTASAWGRAAGGGFSKRFPVRMLLRYNVCKLWRVLGAAARPTQTTANAATINTLPRFGGTLATGSAFCADLPEM